MEKKEKFEDKIEELVGEFEKGTISRRKLLTALSILTVAGSQLGAAGVAVAAETGNETSAKTVTSEQITSAARRVLLERLINHHFDVGPNNQAILKTDQDHFAVFESMEEHQAWLFGESYTNLQGQEIDDYVDEGIVDYDKIGHRQRTDAIKMDIPVKPYIAGDQGHPGADFGSDSAFDASRKGVTYGLRYPNIPYGHDGDKERGLDIIQLGYAIGIGYDYQDLYGLLKLKIQWHEARAYDEGYDDGYDDGRNGRASRDTTNSDAKYKQDLKDLELFQNGGY